MANLFAVDCSSSFLGCGVTTGQIGHLVIVPRDADVCGGALLRRRDGLADGLAVVVFRLPLADDLLAGNRVDDEFVTLEVSLAVSTSAVETGMTSTTVPFCRFIPESTALIWLLGFLLLLDNPRRFSTTLVLLWSSDAMACAVRVVEAASLWSLKHIVTACFTIWVM